VSETLALLLGSRRLAIAEQAGPQLDRLCEAFAAYVDVSVGTPMSPIWLPRGLQML
jgi:hypothetical protein